VLHTKLVSLRNKLRSIRLLWVTIVASQIHGVRHQMTKAQHLIQRLLIFDIQRLPIFEIRFATVTIPPGKAFQILKKGKKSVGRHSED